MSWSPLIPLSNLPLDPQRPCEVLERYSFDDLTGNSSASRRKSLSNPIRLHSFTVVPHRQGNEDWDWVL